MLIHTHMYTEKVKTIMQFMKQMRGKGTLQPCNSSSLLLSFSFHSSSSLAKLRMLAHPQASIRTMAMGLRWIMNVLHNEMLAVHVF